MADIFISYSSEDRDRVISIVKVLEEQGWSTFWDWRSIPVGKTWRQFIEEGLIEASCVLVLWSKKSIVSEWVLEEADYGKSNGMLIPARMDDILPPFGFRQIQAANLINWTGDKINPEFNKLLVALEAIIGPSPKHVQEAERDRKEAGKKGFRKLARLGEKDVLEEVRKISLKELGLDVKTNKNKPVSVLVKQQTAKRTSTLAAIPKTYTNSIGMEFVLIPKGRFMMGSKLSAEEISKRYGGDADIFEYEHPQHEVTISKPFYLQSTSVTQGQWQKITDDNPSYFKEGGDNCPVEKVSWEDAQDFIYKLNEMGASDIYRLPTEAEWEYACRAGTTTEFSFGDDPSNFGEYAWYRGNAEERTHPVAQKAANPWGLYDMHGNVVEWVEDDWHDDYKDAPDDGSAWIKNPRGSSRVLRGGAWLDPAEFCRSADRFRYDPVIRYHFFGFRLVCLPGQ